VASYAPPVAGAAPRPPQRVAQTQLQLQTTPAPPRAGDNEFSVTVRSAAGGPVSDARVELTLSMPAMPSMNMPAMNSHVALSHAGDGVYRGRGPVPMAGRWEARVTATRNGEVIGRRDQPIIVR
jgi:hypothetical protein